MQKQDIANLAVLTVIKANKLFNTNVLEPKVEFFEHGHTAGLAWQEENKLEFNTTLASAYPDIFHKTVIHEVAHLIVHSIYGDTVQAHGPQFKAIDLALGGEGKTYHSYDIEKIKPKRTITRYICSCNCGNGKFTKKVSLGGYICKICKEKLVFTGEIIKIKP